MHARERREVARGLPGAVRGYCVSDANRRGHRANRVRAWSGCGCGRRSLHRGKKRADPEQPGKARDGGSSRGAAQGARSRRKRLRHRCALDRVLASPASA